MTLSSPITQNYHFLYLRRNSTENPDSGLRGRLESHYDQHSRHQDPPKSPLKRGTLNLVPPFLRGARGDQALFKHSLRHQSLKLAV